MPVVTAAVLAVGAAISLGTAMAAATAVVTVSIAIGTLGLAVTAVGMITGNEDLLKAGKIMGYVGLAGGLAGGVIGGAASLASGGGFLQGAAGAYSGAAGFMQQGWDKGIGSFFQPAVGTQVAGPVGNLTTGPVTAANVPPGGVPLTPGVTPNTAQIAGASLQGPGGPSAASPMLPASSVTPTVTPTVTPSPGFVPTPPAPSVGAGNYGAEFLKGTGSGILNTAASPSSPAGVWASMPEWMKYSAVTTGMQGLSGAAAGWFQGASAEERLAFEQLVSQQREAQVQRINKNNQYAPLLNFNGPGTV